MIKVRKNMLPFTLVAKEVLMLLTFIFLDLVQVPSDVMIDVPTQPFGHGAMALPTRNLNHSRNAREPHPFTLWPGTMFKIIFISLVETEQSNSVLWSITFCAEVVQYGAMILIWCRMARFSCRLSQSQQTRHYAIFAFTMQLKMMHSLCGSVSSTTPLKAKFLLNFHYVKQHQIVSLSSNWTNNLILISISPLRYSRGIYVVDNIFMDSSPVSLLAPWTTQSLSFHFISLHWELVLKSVTISAVFVQALCLRCRLYGQLFLNQLLECLQSVYQFLLVNHREFLDS